MSGWPCSGCGRTICTDTRCWACGGKDIRPIPTEQVRDVPSSAYIFGSMFMVVFGVASLAGVAVLVWQAVAG